MQPLDLLIQNARIVDVFRLRTFHGWAGVCGDRFLYVEAGAPPPGLAAADSLDAEGLYLLPGLVDSHMHIESSLMTPRGFASAALPHGTSTVLADPHEVANVAGEAGVRWMIQASKGLALRVFFAIPSCVPATSPDLEWTAAVFDADVVSRLAEEPAVIALGEVMDYQAVLRGSPRLRGLVDRAQEAGLRIEGHVPTLLGMDLDEYLGWRITSDHTLTTPGKLQQQISKGVAVMIQSKSCTPDNMAAVMELPDRSHVLLVTDDVEPTLLVQGHLSLIVQQAVGAGLPPLEAIASASIRPARYLRRTDLGGIAPGFLADFLLSENLESWPPRQVWVGGRKAAESGHMLHPDLAGSPPPPSGALIPGPLAPRDFRLADTGDTGRVAANAVVVRSTETSLTGLERVAVMLQNGFALLQPDSPLALVSVIARNRSSASTGIVKDLGLHEGAFASTFAHDSHNLLVVGRTAEEMATAANAVHEMGGGAAVARAGNVIARLPLPVFGLLSDKTLEAVVGDFDMLEQALRSLGVRHERPFLLLSLLSLSVSPMYKFTDRGVIDTEARRLLPTFERFQARDSGSGD